MLNQLQLHHTCTLVRLEKELDMYSILQVSLMERENAQKRNGRIDGTINITDNIHQGQLWEQERQILVEYSMITLQIVLTQELMFLMDVVGCFRRNLMMNSVPVKNKTVLYHQIEELRCHYCTKRFQFVCTGCFFHLARSWITIG